MIDKTLVHMIDETLRKRSGSSGSATLTRLKYAPIGRI